MRGKAKKIVVPLRRSGITPAYAGKSGGTAGISKMKEDHPRLCGEKMILFLVLLPVLGSPPPMRGKVSLNLCI